MYVSTSCPPLFARSMRSEFEVPKFYVGHYAATARPGASGNGVYSGHVESLSSGNVFANLPAIKVGAEVLLYTEEGLWRYRVTETLKVRYDDLSVMEPTFDPRITLITCIGTWDPGMRQYTHRFIAIAEPIGAAGPEIPKSSPR